MKLKVSPKSDYGLPYVIKIPLEYHMRLRTDAVRGRDDKDFEIFYGTRQKTNARKPENFSENLKNGLKKAELHIIYMKSLWNII